MLLWIHLLVFKSVFIRPTNNINSFIIFTAFSLIIVSSVLLTPGIITFFQRANTRVRSAVITLSLSFLLFPSNGRMLTWQMIQMHLINLSPIDFGKATDSCYIFHGWVKIASRLQHHPLMRKARRKKWRTTNNNNNNIDICSTSPNLGDVIKNRDVCLFFSGHISQQRTTTPSSLQTNMSLHLAPNTNFESTTQSQHE